MPEIRRGGPCLRCGRPKLRDRNLYCSLVCKNVGDRAEQERRFWSKVTRDGRVVPYVGTSCWEWTGAKSESGYGLARIEGRHYMAHRVSWERAHGAIPAGLVVCHRCDNPSCVRLDHLFIGTPADNAHDRDRKGRYVVPRPKRRMRGDDHWTRQNPDRVPRGTAHWRHGEKGGHSAGERNPKAKLTAADVIEMRRRKAAGETATALASEFGVGRSTAQAAIRGKTWATLEDAA